MENKKLSTGSVNLFMAMLHMLADQPAPRFIVPREQRPPWHDVNLSKEERKGKSYEELQAMRKKIWEER